MLHRLVSKGIFACVVLSASLAAGSAAEDRISGNIDTRETAVLANRLHPNANRENDRGPVAPSLALSGITLNVRLSAEQQADLDRLLEEQRDPTSANYQKWSLAAASA
jgi:hypothetical protein